MWSQIIRNLETKFCDIDTNAAKDGSQTDIHNLLIDLL